MRDCTPVCFTTFFSTIIPLCFRLFVSVCYTFVPLAFILCHSRFLRSSRLAASPLFVNSDVSVCEKCASLFLHYIPRANETHAVSAGHVCSSLRASYSSLCCWVLFLSRGASLPSSQTQPRMFSRYHVDPKSVLTRAFAHIGAESPTDDEWPTLLSKPVGADGKINQQGARCVAGQHECAEVSFATAISCRRCLCQRQAHHLHETQRHLPNFWRASYVVLRHALCCFRGFVGSWSCVAKC